jgi:hypothetical protein
MWLTFGNIQREAGGLEFICMAIVTNPHAYNHCCYAYKVTCEAKFHDMLIESFLKIRCYLYLVCLDIRVFTVTPWCKCKAMLWSFDSTSTCIWLQAKVDPNKLLKIDNFLYQKLIVMLYHFIHSPYNLVEFSSFLSLSSYDGWYRTHDRAPTFRFFRLSKKCLETIIKV